MKLKLTYGQFKVLHDLLQNIWGIPDPKGMQAVVLHGLLIRLYKKFYRKNFEQKKKYSVTMEPEEACAFYLFFSKYKNLPEDVFTINLIHQVNNSIHQKYAA